MISPSLIVPTWAAPKQVVAYSTTRLAGVSLPPYDALNLGQHVGDHHDNVVKNRQILSQLAQLPQEPNWLEQVHGTNVVTIEKQLPTLVKADAAYTHTKGQVCAVMTADCLPVLFCSKEGNEVAAAHAGWRSLCNGVLENTLNCFQANRNDIMAWLGPAISMQWFEVGAEVREQFLAQQPEAKYAFIPKGGKYFADLYLLARLRLNAAGIGTIYGGEHCTYTESERFFSYRRDQVTGRMASLIWLK